MESAPFLGNDERLFWQRAEDRNRATASLYDQLSLACYEAMEAFVEYKPCLLYTSGSRHSSLLAIMSAGASRVMSEEELMLSLIHISKGLSVAKTAVLASQISTKLGIQNVWVVFGTF